MTAENNLKPLIYVVDDDLPTLTAIERVLRNDCQVRTFSNPEEALRKIKDEDPALVLTDYTMPQMSGFEFLKKVRSLKPTCVRAIVSGFIKTEELSAAINLDLVHRFFMKPWENDVLRLQILECIAQSKSLHEKETLLALALTDPVTGLGNHRYFQEQLRIEVERAKRHQRFLSMLMVDLDHFKDWNDHFGHPAGDQALKETASILVKGVRNIDSVFRYGGDEFAVILPDTKTENAFEIAERMRASFQQNFRRAPSPVSLSLSLGVASYPEHGSTPRELIDGADKALYESKKHGRNQSKIAAK